MHPVEGTRRRATVSAADRAGAADTVDVARTAAGGAAAVDGAHPPHF